MRHEYLIYAPKFDENVGGAIALHRLCDLLNKMGEKASLWVWDTADNPSELVFEHFDTPLKNSFNKKKTIVIYPEVVSGNPLEAKKVVRWFLHKPGFHTGEKNFGEDELYFFYQPAFNDEAINPHSDHLLQVMYLREDIYYERNNEMPRSGTCYIERKGKGRDLIHNIDESILVDGLSHSKTADIFNTVEVCYCYDLYTMYSRYAALCGCDVIIVPEENLSIEQWRPEIESRYGLAYGDSGVDFMKQTRPKLLQYLRKQEANSNKSVELFVGKCNKYFGFNLSRLLRFT